MGNNLVPQEIIEQKIERHDEEITAIFEAIDSSWLPPPLNRDEI